MYKAQSPALQCGVFLRRAALRPVPPWAVVDERSVGMVEEELDGDEDELQEALDSGYRDLDRLQPILASYLAEEVAMREDELAQSVGYFLVVTVFRAFQEAFPTRLGEVDDDGLTAALTALETDEELRASDPSEGLDSDDVIAMGQPTLIEFVQHHMHEALEQAGDEANLEELDRIYRAVLIEIIALTHAVASPLGDVGVASDNEVQA